MEKGPQKQKRRPANHAKYAKEYCPQIVRVFRVVSGSRCCQPLYVHGQGVGGRERACIFARRSRRKRKRRNAAVVIERERSVAVCTLPSP